MASQRPDAFGRNAVLDSLPAVQFGANSRSGFPRRGDRMLARASDDQAGGDGDGAGAGAVAVEAGQRGGRGRPAEFFRVLGDDGQGRFERLGERHVVEGDDGDVLALAAGQFGD